jgi:SMODS-associated and fused to various effectors sensor domain
VLSEVSRSVGQTISNMLWGRAAGRCQFPGCNKPLWKSSVTQERVNIGQRAHIWSFSSDGPRGHEGIDATDLNSIQNLMLVCHECHQKMDHRKDGGRYTVALLQESKTRHEARIELVTGIDPSRRSHVLLYGANVGDHSSPLSFQLAAGAMFPDRYPAESRPITLGMINSAWKDRDAEFWKIEETNLRRQFDEKVRARLATGDIEHLSVFGFAPQPLLILLGSLLTDITPVDVYQLRREPQGWKWADAHIDVELIVDRPAEPKSDPALVLSLSATITTDRIRAVLGDAASCWTLTLPRRHNDWLQTRDELRAFRQALRPLLDQIKAVHGQTALLHIFPAMPVAAAVELGRVRMPKADMPWCIYDQLNDSGGFIHALTLGARPGR